MRTLNAVALSIALLVSFVASVPVALADASATAEAARLGPGDRVTVTVFGQPDLSGAFQVNGDGSMELPLVGAIPVADLTAKQAEERIESYLANGYILHPSVSVHMGEQRPVYVMGDVRTPGSFPYRSGSSVLNAIAQAGGYGGADAPIGRATAVADFLLSEERLQTLENSLVLLNVRKARLEAQREGKTTFDPPTLPATLMKEPEQAKHLDAAVANEREALGDQTEALKQQLELLRQQRPRLESASAAVEKQIESQKKQIELVKSQLEDWGRLNSKGLALRTTEVSLLREQAALDITISGYRTELARLAVTMGDLDIRIHETQEADRRRVLTELQDVRSKLREIETTLPMARRVREVRFQQTRNAGSSDVVAQTHRIVIKRVVKNTIDTLPASEETLLEPGDIVQVTWLPSKDTAGDYAGTDKGTNDPGIKDKINRIAADAMRMHEVPK